MTIQDQIQKVLPGKTIEDIKWRETFDDGSPIDPDEPEIEELIFTDGTWLEFDGFGKVYYHGRK